MVLEGNRPRCYSFFNPASLPRGSHKNWYRDTGNWDAEHEERVGFAAQASLLSWKSNTLDLPLPSWGLGGLSWYQNKNSLVGPFGWSKVKRFPYFFKGVFCVRFRACDLIFGYLLLELIDIERSKRFEFAWDLWSILFWVLTLRLFQDCFLPCGISIHFFWIPQPNLFHGCHEDRH